MIKAALKIPCFLRILLLLLLLTGTAFAQNNPEKNIKALLGTINAYNDTLAMEQVYLQTDQSAYAAGDTIWFKAYLLQTSTMSAASKSGLLYVELANDSNIIVQRIMLPLFNGLTYGNITLDETATGKCTIRAYTNWMLNSNEAYVFRKNIYVTNTPEKSWLISYNASLPSAGSDEASLNLKLTQLNNTAVSFKNLQLKLANGRRTWFKDKIQTSVDGQLEVKFKVPANADARDLTFSLEELNKDKPNQLQFFPFSMNRPDHIDLQFMPEGGNLIAGLPARLGFKALNEDGLGADVSGSIYNSRKEETGVFKSDYKGMGSFYFVPEAGEKYTASLKLPDGKSKDYPLPEVKSAGVVMKVNNPFDKDTCTITFFASPDVVAANKGFFLIGTVRGTAYVGAAVTFNKASVRLKFSKKLFPTGVLNFTLLNADKLPVLDRNTFIDHSDQLQIDVATDKGNYGPRDSVQLNITVKDHLKQPVSGNFSIAITDNGQVKKDVLAGSILSNLLLTSGIRGNIETPGYYLDAVNTENKWTQLDEMLLTQGWVGYTMMNAFKPVKPPVFEVEPDFQIKGRVTNMFNKPVPNVPITVFSKRPLVVLDTLTDANGRFAFKGIFSIDTAIYFLSTRNKRNKTFNVGIEVNEFKPPVLSASAEKTIPWYVNVDPEASFLVKNQLLLKNEQARVTGKNTIKEVVIVAKKVVKDSKNLLGPGEADVILDEKDMEKARKATLGDVLMKRVSGLAVLRDKANIPYYSLNNTTLHLVFDGVQVDFFKPEDMSQYDYYKDYFDYFDAEEIKGIEVMKTGKYQMAYTNKFLDPRAKFYEHSFIEITTRSGHGPFSRKSASSYLFKPLPFSLPKKFYAPAYQPNSVADGSDIRSTIHWEPDVNTGSNGKATVKFFTADQQGTYTIIVEGTDLQGTLGTKQKEMQVKKGVNN